MKDVNIFKFALLLNCSWRPWKISPKCQKWPSGHTLDTFSLVFHSVDSETIFASSVNVNPDYLVYAEGFYVFLLAISRDPLHVSMGEL